MVLNKFEVGDIIRIDLVNMVSQYYIFTFSPVYTAGFFVNLATGETLFGGANILALDNDALKNFSRGVNDWEYVGREEDGLREVVSAWFE